MLVREVIKRDLSSKIEGVVKVFDRAALPTEFRDFVVTDKLEEDLKSILDAFTLQSDALRRKAAPSDVMGVWISGFFGSGKSHFAKVLGCLLQNEVLDSGDVERPTDIFVRLLSETQRGKTVALRLRELERTARIRTIAFEINSRDDLSNPGSVGSILLSEFYRHIGLAENVVVARIERHLERRGLLAALESNYESRYATPWKSKGGRDDLMTVRRRLAEVLPVVDSVEYPDVHTAKKALDDMFKHGRVTAEGIADELIAWVDAQALPGGQVQHLVFVIDEMGTFIGDSVERIAELQSIAEMLGSKGKGKVWLIVTSQQDLEKVVDRTNFQPALVGRLNARFQLKAHLISDEINKVVAERILKKIPANEPALEREYAQREGRLAQLGDLKASRHLPAPDQRGFVASYPFLPHQIQLAQEIFEALSGFRISGGVRSMISVVMDTLQSLADEELGVLASFDQIFDAVEKDLLSQEYLGASGIRAIRESDERVPGTPVEPSRVLKVLWLIGKVHWVPRVPETLAKLLANHLDADIAALRVDVETTLLKLQEAGYVARDEATGEWKYLNERERTIEQLIQEMMRPGGPRTVSLASVRRTAQEICKADVFTRKKLNNFSVLFGKSKVPFPFAVHLDGEAIETGPDVEVLLVSPLAPGLKDTTAEVRASNQAAGVKGRKVWWVASMPAQLQARLKRYEALVKITSDKRFTDDSSRETQDALADKRKERDELRTSLVKDIEAAFLAGTLFYGGQEIPVEGAGEIKDPVTRALTAVLPGVFPRFALADCQLDFAKHLKAYLNPATTALQEVAPELHLFDTQGSLQHQSPLASQILEVLADLEDEGVEATGAALLDRRGNGGFQGFSRPPFGWPGELVRLVLAACHRAGAVYPEEPTGAGLVPRFDYRNASDLYAKINTFRKLHFHVSETSLSVDEIKRACKLLIELGVQGVPESGNAIAAAVRQLGVELSERVREATRHADSGLPIAGAIVNDAPALDEATSIKDPTKAVKAFLTGADSWRRVSGELAALGTFLEANHHAAFSASRRLATLVATHPLPKDHARQADLARALADMDALVAGRHVVARWPDYRHAADLARDCYRQAYSEAYAAAQEAARDAASAVRASAAFAQADPGSRDAAVDQVFGAEGSCAFPEVNLASTAQLLDAASRNSLTALGQALVAIPGYRHQVEARLREMPAAQPTGAEPVTEWAPSATIGGRVLSTEDDLKEMLDTIDAALRPLLRSKRRIVVK